MGRRVDSLPSSPGSRTEDCLAVPSFYSFGEINLQRSNALVFPLAKLFPDVANHWSNTVFISEYGGVFESVGTCQLFAHQILLVLAMSFKGQ